MIDFSQLLELNVQQRLVGNRKLETGSEILFKRLPNIGLMIFGAWMVALSTSLPTYFAVDRFEFPVKYNTAENSTEVQIQSICGPIDERMGKIRIVKCIFLFFVPLLIMSYCYAAGN